MSCCTHLTSAARSFCCVKGWNEGAADLQGTYYSEEKGPGGFHCIGNGLSSGYPGLPTVALNGPDMDASRCGNCIVLQGSGVCLSVFICVHVCVAVSVSLFLCNVQYLVTCIVLHTLQTACCVSVSSSLLAQRFSSM